jgi:hypothetical protein
MKMLSYFMDIWYTLWPFGIVCGNLVYFSRFGMFGPRKIWQPWKKVAPRTFFPSKNSAAGHFSFPLRFTGKA